jgi:hypothetical protein
MLHVTYLLVLPLQQKNQLKIQLKQEEPNIYTLW